MIQLQDNNDVQFCNTTNLDNELQNNLEKNENNNDMLNYIPSNIYDSGNWKNIDTKLRDLLVERSTMSQERLNGLIILLIKKEMLEALEYKNLISQFASPMARKINFK